MEHGPAFLQSPEEEWPQETVVLEQELAQVNMERRKAAIVCTLTLSKAEEEINKKKVFELEKIDKSYCPAETISSKGTRTEKNE